MNEEEIINKMFSETEASAKEMTTSTIYMAIFYLLKELIKRDQESQP